ncbi:hypothetical protein ABKN59_011593 [Abortiporus biennis]
MGDSFFTSTLEIIYSQISNFIHRRLPTAWRRGLDNYEDQSRPSMYKKFNLHTISFIKSILIKSSKKGDTHGTRSNWKLITNFSHRRVCLCGALRVCTIMDCSGICLNHSTFVENSRNNTRVLTLIKNILQDIASGCLKKKLV